MAANVLPTATPHLGLRANPPAGSSSAASSSGSASSGSASGSASSGSASSSGSGSASSSGSGSASPSGSASATGSSSSAVSISSGAPAGILSFLHPPQSSTSFFKIAPSNPITFVWNLTYVIATPTSLTISAVGENSNTYPVGPTNGIIPGSATSVVWDPYAYNENSAGQPTLGMGTYSLKIWGDQGPNKPQQPGYMTENSALQFALYTPQPYTPIASGWSCSTCNGSVSAIAFHPAFLGMMITFAVMFLSGWGIIRR